MIWNCVFGSLTKCGVSTCHILPFVAPGHEERLPNNRNSGRHDFHYIPLVVYQKDGTFNCPGASKKLFSICLDSWMPLSVIFVLFKQRKQRNMNI